MSLWLDMVGCEVRYIQTASFGRIRIAEAGPKDAPVIMFLHGIGGHLEAYCKNILPLSEQFHVIAFDFVGHAMSERKVMEYTPLVLAEQTCELMDAMKIERAHLSGESLGGWVAGFVALNHPERVQKVMFNTGAGIPIVSDQGRADLADLAARSKKAAGIAPNFDAVKHRIEWLIHPDNHHLVTDELVNLRLQFYLMPEGREVTPLVNQMMPRHDEFLLPLEDIKQDVMMLWTRNNPVHDLECAEAAVKRLPSGRLYVMEADGAHWPQYEAPEEFNRVARAFFGR